MRLKFKNQAFQTDAVNAVVDLFTGQEKTQSTFSVVDERQTSLLPEMGQGNALYIDQETLTANMHTVQKRNNLPLTPSAKDCQFCIEMETGTGKTYVYTKTIFELNRKYGFTKFVIVVPSVAIREGVYQALKTTQECFTRDYKKPLQFFIYRSDRLTDVERFASDNGIHVMIINMQAFNSSKSQRVIDKRQDTFRSRRPIDLIAQTNPILIIDEPQSVEGRQTQEGLKKFNPLFTLRYSATHRKAYDMVYRLDAMDAYNLRLVKKIAALGVTLTGSTGTSGYVYLEGIDLDRDRPPVARVGFEVRGASGARPVVRTLRRGDDLYERSKRLDEYADRYVITEIDGRDNSVTFLNGLKLYAGQFSGGEERTALQRRVQIRETIRTHLRRERELYSRGVKVLSLFFIDEVAKYKSYDENREEVKGVFQKIFEEEYARLVNEEFYIWDEDYNEYLRRFMPQDVHRGYFSINKKTNRVIDGKVEKKTGLSDDISAYDLILKNKERLLSFEEPTRFIFSHSALREGWDNPNVFQICTLRHSNSSTAKRQEVGRGLRICVDRHGVRMDKELLGEDVHEVNRLTVIANESYADFTTALQKETREVLRERAAKATVAYFQDRQIKIEEEIHTITETEASRIIIYLEDNGYIDEDKHITPDYREAVANGTVAPLPPKLQPIAEGVVRLINSIFDPKVLDDMVVEEKTTTPDNRLNENFRKAEFQALWNEINYQYVYTVSYDSNELIEKASLHINAELKVKQLRYVMVEGTQDEEQVTDFGDTRSQSRQLTDVCTSSVRYDLVGDIAKGANLTRRTVVKILQGIKTSKLYLFKNNPEEFIRKVVSIIKEQKATMIVEAIHYNMTEGKYDSSIFTVKSKMDFDRAYEAKKHITDYVFSDSKGERQFAHDLDEANEVVVYAKLPRTFQIPTPVGNYAPDWAIAMTKDGVKHIFFIAETKGSMSSMDLSAIEKAKIACAEKLFNSISTSNVKYHKVATYQDLIDEMNAG